MNTSLQFYVCESATTVRFSVGIQFFVQTVTQELCSEGEVIEKLNVSKNKDQQQYIPKF